MKFNILRNPAVRRAIYSVLERYRARDSISIATLSDDYISKELLSSGWYERPFLRLLKKLIKSNLSQKGIKSYVVDIGANIGNHSLYFSSQVDHVISVEPNPICVNLLKASIEVNAINNIIVIPKGAGLKAETLCLNFDESHTGGGSFLDIKEGILPRSIDVEIETLDSIVNENVDNNSKIKLIKIDAEGFEVNVIKGAQKTLMTHSPMIAFEAHGLDNYNNISQSLKDEGYQSFYRLIQARRIYKSFILNALNMFFRPSLLKIEKIQNPDDTNYQMVIAIKDKSCSSLDYLNGYFNG
tara:strand:- start:12845 stop:13738 length:894 start_codon:yes stop_codon:yes gene_type:complete